MGGSAVCQTCERPEVIAHCPGAVGLMGNVYFCVAAGLME